MRLVHLALVALFALGCPSPTPTPTPTPTPPSPSRALKVTSECADPIWIQQQNHTGAPALTKLTKGTSTTYSIPDAGLPSTRKAIAENPDYFVWWYTVKSVGLGIAAAYAAYLLGRDHGRRSRS